jgi:putative membrane protein
MFEWHGFGGGGMWMFWSLITISLIWLVTFATRREIGSLPRQKSAQRILEERYARGEIERDEFEQKKKDLSD